MKWFELLLTAVLAGLVALGCESPKTPSGAAEMDETADSGSGQGTLDTSEVGIALADRAGYDELIASKKGKVVLVDFWATWCLPCIKQFPHTVEVSNRFDPTKLAVVSVSMDEPDDKDKALKFLQGTGATFDNLISKYGVGQKGFEAFEITDGAIPHYKIYDRKGELRHTAGSNDEIEQLVEQLLNEES